ncbi:unnamed protein product [Macrosiphum euphorbiae]|uniref:C2H2-type domain-containing protein n=1 Tax=Macrosiphum euphorbiae TaxID=13131 RepID=A0AAV0XL93_9HEMI|nr:unnamed protein product [Macrosiphum euphorbiae]
MEPFKPTIIDDSVIDSKFKDIIQSSKVLIIPLIRCDDKVFNGIIKQKNIENQVFNGIFKKEIIDKITDGLHNNSKLLGPRVEPLRLNTVCGDQVFDGVNKQENIDSQVFNGIFKEEIIDETDHHSDGQLPQKGTRTEEKENTIDTEIKIKKEIIDEQEFEGTVLNENHSSKFITCLNTDITFNNKRKNPFNNIRDTISPASNLTVRTWTHKLHKCDICGIRFSKVSDLTRHARIHTREKPYKCDFCDTAFARASCLTIHNKTHAREPSYKLRLNTVCGDQVFDGVNKQENIDRQVFNGIFKEEIIDETDHHYDGQLPQKGTRTEEKENIIDTEINIKKEIIDEQEFEGTVLNENHSSEFMTCLNTDITFNNKRKNPFNNIRDTISPASNLTVRTWTHKLHECDIREKPYKCDICDTAFARASCLTNHKKAHAREPSYKCDICSIRLSRASHLTRHKRTHTVEKTYKCDVCDQAFFQAYNLNIHKRTHSGKRPHKCDVCNTKFYYLSHLTRHKRTHTGEKPYKCKFCDQDFAQNYNLTTHERIHNGEKPYSCDICGLQFSDASNLRRHSKKSHNGKKA